MKNITSKTDPVTELKIPKEKLLTRITLWFFKRPQLTAIIWVLVVLFGVLSYTTLLQRAGFPTINLPYGVIKGAYFVNDPAKVDADVAKPLSNVVLDQKEVKTVKTQSFDNFYAIIVQYEEGTDANAVTKAIEKQAKTDNTIPENATADFSVPKIGYTERGDSLVVSLYKNNNSDSTAQLTAKATEAAVFLNNQNISLASDISVINPFEKAPDPLTGEVSVQQKSFDRFGQRQDNENNFYGSVAIGMTAADGADVLELDKQVDAALANLNANPAFKGYTAVLSASVAPQITDQISELQKVLLEGLIAVLIVGSIIIAFRASIITVISMVTVIAVTLGVMYLIGFTLNTITLFALILGLSLVVDDTIIMVEAIDAQRKRHKDPTKAVRVATRKVSRAMVAATLTAALSFAPLIFVSGILGSFIRSMPITIISALLISLVVALLFIPMFARVLLLGKSQMGEEHSKELAAGFEKKIARGLSAPMLWAKGSRKKLFAVGITALVIGFGFIGAGAAISKYVGFNIFPQDKDSNGLTVTLTFPAQTSITEAEKIADQADQIVGKTLDANFSKASYYSNANAQSATLSVDLINYADRETTSVQLTKQLEKEFAGFSQAGVAISQVGAGPPASAFMVRIDATNREEAQNVASDMAKYLENDAVLKRPDGTVATIKQVTVSNSDVILRQNGEVYVSVSAEFVDSDTTTLVNLTKTAVENEFDAARLESSGLDKNSLKFDFGQEDENQQSFAVLMFAFPILLAVIYVLLAFQFKSLLQPLLIFMALPFSFFGIALGLYLSNNVFSFFAMLGFFALIGLSIKNTILLTDYANQSRRAGMDAVDAAHEALAERFRPLIATSLTAVVSLIPLALTSPFWEGLAIVLISGLLSSTFLVITVFPYYYLGAEYLRGGVSRKVGIAWLIATIVLVVAIGWLLAGSALTAPIIGVILLVSFVGVIWYAGRRRSTTA